MNFFDWKYYVEYYKLDIDNKEDAYKDWIINQRPNINRFYIFKDEIDYLFCIYYYNIKNNDENIIFNEIKDYIIDIIEIRSLFDININEKKRNFNDINKWQSYISYLNILTTNSTLNRNILGYPINTGISIFTVCMDRNENLKISLKNWLENEDVDEIIILDWNSKIPVSQTLNIQSNKINIITVKDIDTWILTKSFNLASKFTKYDKICKLDCDYVISREFFKEHKLKDNIFYSSNYNKCIDKISLSGFLYINRFNFMKINGYDERIITYGWDDDDIKNRLMINNIYEKQININLVDHIPHTDDDRTKNQNIIDTQISTYAKK